MTNQEKYDVFNIALKHRETGKFLGEFGLVNNYQEALIMVRDHHIRNADLKEIIMRSCVLKGIDKAQFTLFKFKKEKLEFRKNIGEFSEEELSIADKYSREHYHWGLDHWNTEDTVRLINEALKMENNHQ